MSIQHKSRLPNIALDDEGRPCGSVPFRYPSEASDPEREDEARLRRQVLFRMLHLLTKNAGTKRVGRRVIVLAFVAGATPFTRQKQLAKKLKVSPSRASRIVNSLKREFAKLATAD